MTTNYYAEVSKAIKEQVDAADTPHRHAWASGYLESKLGMIMHYMEREHGKEAAEKAMDILRGKG